MDYAARAQESKNLGNAAFKDGKHDEAIKHYTEAISVDPDQHVFYRYDCRVLLPLSSLKHCLLFYTSTAIALLLT